MRWILVQVAKAEDYQEPEVKKNKPKIPSCVSPLSMKDIDLMIKTISQEDTW
jgi:transposase